MKWLLIVLSVIFFAACEEEENISYIEGEKLCLDEHTLVVYSNEEWTIEMDCRTLAERYENKDRGICVFSKVSNDYECVIRTENPNEW